MFQAFEASGFIVQDEKVGKPVDIRKASNASVAAAKAVSHTNELAYQPIASLNPYQSSWTIKVSARCNSLYCHISHLIHVCRPVLPKKAT